MKATYQCIDLIDDPEQRMDVVRERANIGACIYCGAEPVALTDQTGRLMGTYKCPFNLVPDECAEYLRREMVGFNSHAHKRPSPLRDACAVVELAVLVVLIAFLTHVLGILLEW